MLSPRNHIFATTAIITLSFVLAVSTPSAAQQRDYPIHPVPFTNVTLDDAFWAPRLRTNKDITIPIAFKKAEETGRIDNFKIAGKLMPGKFRTLYPFDDSDVFKNIEAAAYALQISPDPSLEAYLDTLIAYIAAAQEPDGYLYTCRTIDPVNPHEWSLGPRWEHEEELSHELYNVGHMYEAAVAYYLATGKRTFLNVALKNADLVDKDFGWGKNEKAPGHQVIEMGLVKLYRVTGEERYLKLAKFFIDVRGTNPTLGEYAQNHKRFVEQDSAVGHAVRAEYLYSGAADIAALTGQDNYIRSLKKIWEDVVHRKMYITGGTGASGGNEGFGPAYDLPNMSAYCETCASIADVFWNYRMFLLFGESNYFDVLERILYNALLSGVSLSGDRFFYPNPLSSMGQHSRAEWFGCACCPVNITRLLPSILGYVYAAKENDLYVNLYMQNSGSVMLRGESIAIRQRTTYPWNGKVTISVTPTTKQRFSLLIRIPGWARGEAIPGDLYRFNNAHSPKSVILVNGVPFDDMTKDGYARIDREWMPGDSVTLDFPMPVQLVEADDRVKANTGKIALQRGPLVYCAEGIDNPDRRVLNIVMNDAASLTTKRVPGLLNGVYTIQGTAGGAHQRKDGSIEIRRQPFVAVPYYAWANRGAGEMSVWFGTSASSTHAIPLPSPSSTGTVTALHPRKTLFVVNGPYVPSSSIDSELPSFNWHPRRDTVEWIQNDFNGTQTVSTARVYWVDDGPGGNCRLPISWKVYYKSGDAWMPVNNATPYEIVRDRFSVVSFSSITTGAVRLEVVLPKEHSSGLFQWIVE